MDIPGAFIQTKMPKDEKDVHVVLDSRMTELLAKIAPETYQEYIHQQRGPSIHILQTQRCSLRNSKGCPTILEETIIELKDSWV